MNRGGNDMNEEIAKKAEQAVWAAKSLFERGKTAGSTANLSFRHEGCIYISGSGTCFGTLKSEDFAVMDMDGNHVGGPAPSKEYPLHRLLYEKKGVTSRCQRFVRLPHTRPAGGRTLQKSVSLFAAARISAGQPGSC